MPPARVDFSSHCSTASSANNFIPCGAVNVSYPSCRPWFLRAHFPRIASIKRTRQSLKERRKRRSLSIKDVHKITKYSLLNAHRLISSAGWYTQQKAV
jgi:hypothetical protein